jgi:Tfp pilus assembly PilM family ATPase
MAAQNKIPVKKMKQVLAGSAEMDKAQYRKSLEKASKKIVADITETLRYYDTQKKAEPLKKMYVCGDFALAEGFIEILNKQLPVETVLWNPFDKIKCDTGRTHRGMLQKSLLQKNGPAMAVAAGLAMRSI